MNPFVVISHGRSGSTLLIRSLDAHPDIKCYGELFNAIEKDRVTAAARKYSAGDDPIAFCRAEVYGEASSAKAVGFKLHVNQMKASEREKMLWTFLEAERDIRIIFLVRRNLFDPYISNQRAIRAKQWRRTPDQDVSAAYLEPLPIDIDHCIQAVKVQAQIINATSRSFRNHRRLDMTYEALASDFQPTLDAAFAFLDVEPRPVEPPLGRMNQVSHEQGIANYDDVKARFADPALQTLWNFVPER